MRPNSPLRHKPIVLLARNPCDIAVSWFFQFTKRQSAHKQELINASIDHPIDRRTIGMWDFVRHSDIGLPFLIDYLNGWQRNLAGLERGLMVRYEDLRARPGPTLRQITELMGESFSDAEIEEAVNFGSFDNLRALETKGFFRQGGLDAAQSERPGDLQGAARQGGRLSRLFYARAGRRARGADGRAAVAGVRLRHARRPDGARRGAGVSAPCAARCMPCESQRKI